VKHLRIRQVSIAQDGNRIQAAAGTITSNAGENMSYATVQTRSPARTAGRIALWMLQIAVGAFFIMGGWSKVVGFPEMVGLFDAIGFGQWFRYVTGLLEVAGGVLLFIPGVAAVGAVLLAGIMVGAVLTHVFLIGGSAAIAIVLFGLSSAIAFARRDELARVALSVRTTDSAAS